LLIVFKEAAGIVSVCLADPCTSNKHIVHCTSEFYKLSKLMGSD